MKIYLVVLLSCLLCSVSFAEYEELEAATSSLAMAPTVSCSRWATMAAAGTSDARY